ncbi:MAG: hypothetical protein LW847_16175 [Burkholderiales bacterium]|nr:hypothetical protein [Burkholderiales bacterium]
MQLGRAAEEVADAAVDRRTTSRRENAKPPARAYQTSSQATRRSTRPVCRTPCSSMVVTARSIRYQLASIISALAPISVQPLLEIGPGTSKATSQAP